MDWHRAAATGNCTALQRLAASLTAPTLLPAVNRYNCWGSVPLHAAIFFGHPDAVHLLLRLGANPNALVVAGRRRTFGWCSPLHLVAMGGMFVTKRSGAARGEEMAGMLVEAGADGSIRDERGLTPTETAAANGLKMEMGKVTARISDSLLGGEGHLEPSSPTH